MNKMTQDKRKAIVDDFFDDDNKKSIPPTQNIPLPSKASNIINIKALSNDPNFNLLQPSQIHAEDSDDDEATPKQDKKIAYNFSQINFNNNDSNNEFDLLKSHLPQPINANANSNDLQKQQIIEPNQINLDFDNIPNVNALNQNINFDNILNNINFKDDVKLNDKQLKEFEAKNHDPILSSKNNQKALKNKNILNNMNEGNLFDDLDDNDEFKPKERDFARGNEHHNKDGIDLNKIQKYNQPNGSIKTKETQNHLALKKEQFFNKTFFTTLNKQSLNIPLNNNINEIDEETLAFQLNSDIEDILMTNEHLSDSITSQLKNETSQHDISAIGLCTSYNNSQGYYLLELSCIRSVQCDGDGLFRAFMFSYGELLISQQNIFELKKIAYVIHSKGHIPFIYRDASFDPNEILIIFSFIFNALEKNQMKEANEIWFKAFNKIKGFSLSLIKYAKQSIGDYIISNSDKFDSKELISNNIINECYIKNNQIECNDYLSEKVLKMNCDDEAFLIYLIPVVFNISLIIYSIENEPKKMTFTTSSKYSSPITLLYAECKYFVTYQHDYFKKYHELMSSIVFQQQKQSRFEVFVENASCDICSNISDEILFTHMSIRSFCKHCLINALNKVISKRISFLTHEEFSNVEYYARPIELSSNKEHVINDDDMKDLTGSSILDQIMFLMKNTCLLCGTGITDNEMFITMPCDCRLCKNCIGQLIIKDTDDKIYLNQFEKKYYKIKPSLCVCGKPFDVDYAIKQLYNESELNEQKKKSNERMETYIQKYCLLCRELQKHNPINMEGNNLLAKEYYLMIPINSQDDPGIVNREHIMCKRCSYAFKEKINDKLKEGSLDKKEEDIPIDCLVCDKAHKIKLKIFKSLAKENEVNCCSIF